MSCTYKVTRAASICMHASWRCDPHISYLHCHIKIHNGCVYMHACMNIWTCMASEELIYGGKYTEFAGMYMHRGRSESAIFTDTKTCSNQEQMSWALTPHEAWHPSCSTSYLTSDAYPNAHLEWHNFYHFYIQHTLHLLTRSIFHSPEHGYERFQQL